MPPASTAALLEAVVDYAGLFPPAALAMVDAVAEYGVAAAGPDAWMLGRFVVPAARLDELGAALDPGAVDRPWRVSAIVGDGSEADAAAVARFNQSTAGRARVDSIESRPQSAAAIDWLAQRFGDGFEIYVEVAPGPEAEAWLARIAAAGLHAKVRTGGVTAEAFPSASALASFLDAAVRLGVPFKATAGLHHAVRGPYRLTYEPGSASASMYGYLNVLLATAALETGGRLEEAVALLQQTDGAALVFDDTGLHWGAARFSSDALRSLRARRFLSFGSCSFREPAAEIAALTA